MPAVVSIPHVARIRADWLDDVVQKLSRGRDGRASVRELLALFRIKVKYVDRLDRPWCYGRVIEDVGGYYELQVVRRSKGHARTRERFTIAHEIAHILLHREFGFRAVSRREYWIYEDICNEFAAKFLVPDSAVATLSRDDPFADIERLAQRHDVSREVIARRFASQHADFGIIAFVPKTNAAGESVVRVLWSAGNAVPARGRDLGHRSRLGQALVDAIRIRGRTAVVTEAAGYGAILVSRARSGDAYYATWFTETSE